MHWYHWLAVAALAVCIISCIYHFFRIIKLGAPPEYARRAGNIGSAVRYSFTGAMSPFQKESAYLHWPTYTAGIIYHIGTFLAIALFFLAIFKIGISTWMIWPVIIFLSISTACGFGILIKRITKHELSSLSNPDDYISNILVSLFQAVTAITLYAAMHQYDLWALYFVISAMLLLYFPLGKLKHAVYFFAARYHLGFFYGWRGVWPPKPIKK
jgi:nitrate reductase gamma subunit